MFSWDFYVISWNLSVGKAHPKQNMQKKNLSQLEKSISHTEILETVYRLIPSQTQTKPWSPLRPQNLGLVDLWNRRTVMGQLRKL